MYLIVSQIQGWVFARQFSEWIASFLHKNERMSNSLLKMSDVLICSFLVNNLSNSLTVAHFWWVTWVNRSRLLIFGEQPERFAHSCSFVISDLSNLLLLPFKKEGMSESLIFLKTSDLLIHSFIMCNLSKSLMVALLSWVTWAIRSQSLICPERSEQIVHSCSSKWTMSKWANEQTPNPAQIYGVGTS